MSRKTRSRIFQAVIGLLLALVSLAQGQPSVRAANLYAAKPLPVKLNFHPHTPAHIDDMDAHMGDHAVNNVLELFITASPPIYRANGDVITITFEIKNTDPAPLAGPFSVDGTLGSIPCGTGPLAPNGTIRCTTTYPITSTDMEFPSIFFSFNAADATSPAISDTQTLQLDKERREMSMLKSADRTTYSVVGDVITYKYVIKNEGNVPLAAPFTVIDDKLGTITPCGSGPLAVGATTFCTKTYPVTQADIDAGSITNEAFAQNSGATSCTFCNNKVTVNWTAAVAANTTTKLTAAPNPSTRVQTVALKATVTSASGTPTGNVTFLEGTTALGATPLDANGVAALNLITLTVGIHPITAKYEGNNAFNLSNSAPVTQTVTKVPTTFILRFLKTPVAVGTPFTFTVLLGPASPLAQTGSVKLLHENSALGPYPLKDVTDPVTGTKFRGVEFITNTFPSGVHTLRVRYDGDSNFTDGTSDYVTKTVTGLQNSAPLYVRSSPNPAQVGKPITLIVEVMPVSDRQTGNVKFFADGQPLGTIPLKDGCDPGNPKCRTATLTTGTLATLATSTPPAGRHIITATYEGDNNYSLSTSSPLTQTITISPVKDLKPITLTVASGNKAMQLNWNPTSDPTVNSYNILRHAGVNDRIKTLAAKLPLKPEYPDSNALVPGLTYCYRVEARRNDGTVAVTSNEACKVFGALELSVPDTLGRPGEIVIVPVNIANANGLRIASSDIWLDFNGAIIQSVVVSRTALTKNYTWDFSVQDSATPPTTTKRLRIALINNKPEELRGTGPLFWLVFKVKGQPGQPTRPQRFHHQHWRLQHPGYRQSKPRCPAEVDGWSVYGRSRGRRLHPGRRGWRWPDSRQRRAARLESGR